MGVDPGANAVGFCVVEEGRVLATGDLRPRGSLGQKLLLIHSKITDVLEEFRPDLLVMEAVIYHKNPKTALVMGAARGVVLLAATQKRVPVEEISPTAVKKAVSGAGRAGKESVLYMVRRLYNIQDDISEHVADALAVAWCGETMIKSLRCS
ncbi:MAG: crossover junction endodeoxyribonuclease RuvC [Candidatus Hydrothermia bacterium]